MVPTDFFSYCTSLSLLELKAIGALSQVRHFHEGDFVYSVRDEGEELFVIARGAVELLPENANRDLALVFSRGEIFGVYGAFMNERRDHSARACSSLSVQAFRRSDFPKLVQRVPSFFLFLSGKLAVRVFQANKLALSHNSALELSGSLANFDVVTIYQTIMQSRQTGLLTIADEKGATISRFYFTDGRPRWGRFEHLVGEEAAWQLFLQNKLAATFSFSQPAEGRGPNFPGSRLKRRAEEILITAIHLRDQFDHLRERLSDPTVKIRPEEPELHWENPELAQLRPVAQAIWQLLAPGNITLGALYPACTFCELKIYQVVEELLNTGLISLKVPGPEEMLVVRHA